MGHGTRCVASSVCTYFAEVGGECLHFVTGVEVEVGQPRDAQLLAEVHHLLRVSVHLLQKTAERDQMSLSH
jgi:hypothetical protein